MRLILRSVARAAATLTVALPIAAAGALAFYLPWKNEHLRELERGSRVIETARGAIELATRGAGEPLLVIHGTPGGYDSGLRGAELAAFEGFGVIAVSRPGYLRTPLDSGRTPAEQADLYAAGLDALGVERAVVLGISGGGPSALALAVRHPERTSALILAVPLLRRYTGAWSSPGPNPARLLIYDVSTWLFGAQSIGRSIGGFDPDNEEHAAEVRAMAEGRIPFALRRSGHVNDGERFLDLDIEPWPLEAVRVPTLILHGSADANAPYAGAVRAAARIPTAELFTVEGADHFILITHVHEIEREVARFLASRSLPAARSPRTGGAAGNRTVEPTRSASPAGVARELSARSRRRRW